MCWKLILLAVWLIGQTLGFGMTGICHESLYYAQPSAVWQQILPANCGYDALPNEAIRGYDCPAHPASAYDNPINHSTGGEKRSFEGIRPLFASTAEFLAAESGASSALQGARLSEHLTQLEKYGSQGFKELENGNIRYYGDLKAASTPGEMSGARLVREWNPETGAKRTWYETLDHSGTVRSVRPETGGPKVHYIFDANGNYTGTR